MPYRPPTRRSTSSADRRMGGAVTAAVAVCTVFTLYAGPASATPPSPAPGDITTVAGNGTQGYSGDGGPALEAEFNFSTGGASLSVDAAGNIVIPDPGNNRVRLLAYASTDPFLPDKALTPGDIYTLAGNGVGGYSGDSGPAATCQLNYPEAVTIDPSGNLLIADSRNGVIRLVAARTSDPVFPGASLTAGDIYRVAGDTFPGYSGDGGQATQAALNNPGGLVLDRSGNLVVANSDESALRLVAVSSSDPYLPGKPLTPGDIYTLAGSMSGSGFAGDGGPATSSLLKNPWPLVVDRSGNLLLADDGNSVIRLIAASAADPLLPGHQLVAGDIYLVAGDGQVGDKGNGGPAIKAEIDAPEGMAVDANGNLLVSDTANNMVRLVAATKSDRLLPGRHLVAGDIYRVIGSGNAGRKGDGGPAARADLNAPGGIVVGAHGSVYVEDLGNSVVREVALPAPTGRAKKAKH